MPGACPPLLANRHSDRLRVVVSTWAQFSNHRRQRVEGLWHPALHPQPLVAFVQCSRRSRRLLKFDAADTD